MGWEERGGEPEDHKGLPYYIRFEVCGTKHSFVPHGRLVRVVN